MKRHNGFILIDLLFGMAILLVVVGLLYPCYVYLLKTYDVINQNLLNNITTW